MRDVLPETPVGRAAWLLSVAASLFIACYDPFDLGTRSETAADATVQRLNANASPRSSASAITLVEVTRGTLEDQRLGTTYPLSYGSQATLVQAAVASGALAVFLDFEYLRNAHDADGMQALAGAVGEAVAAGVPVFTGPIADDRPDLAPLAKVGRQTGVRLDRAHPADYPLASVLGDGTVRPTAALDLYEAGCRRSPAQFSGCRRPPTAIAGAAVAVPFGGVDVRGADDFLDVREVERCRRGNRWESFRTALLGRPDGAPCPRYLTVPAQFPLNGADDAVQKALRGRLVLIGSGPGLGDDKSIPGVGTVPGLVLHAAALEELLADGRDYPSWPRDFPHMMKVGPDELLKLATIVVLPPFATGVAGLLERRRKAGRITRRRAALLMVLVLLALAGSLVLWALLSWAFFDWPMAMALLVAALSTLALGLASTEEVARVLAPLNKAAVAWAMVLLIAAAALVVAASAALLWCVLAVTAAALVTWGVRARIAAGVVNGKGMD